MLGSQRQSGSRTKNRQSAPFTDATLEAFVLAAFLRAPALKTLVELKVLVHAFQGFRGSVGYLAYLIFVSILSLEYSIGP